MPRALRGQGARPTATGGVKKRTNEHALSLRAEFLGDQALCRPQAISPFGVVIESHFVIGAYWGARVPEIRSVHLGERGDAFVRELPGPVDAPVLFLLHGWTASGAANFAPAYEALAEHFRVISIDHRGHGRGPLGTGQFRLVDCADDIAAVADAMGIEKFSVAGYSMGGPIALLTARRHPERVESVVLAATAARLGRNALDRLLFRASSEVANMVERVPFHLRHRMQLDFKHPSGEQPVALEVLEDLLSASPLSLIEAAGEMGRFDARPWLHEITQPVTVLATERDHLVPIASQEATARHLPDAMILRINAGHNLPILNSELFTDALVTSCVTAANRAGAFDRARERVAQRQHLSVLPPALTAQLRLEQEAMEQGLGVQLELAE